MSQTVKHQTTHDLLDSEQSLTTYSPSDNSIARDELFGISFIISGELADIGDTLADVASDARVERCRQDIVAVFTAFSDYVERRVKEAYADIPDDES